MPNSRKLVRNSTAGARAQSACLRACADYDRVTELAEQVGDDIDDLTIPGIPNVEIDPESSIVTVLEDAILMHTEQLKSDRQS